MSRGIGGCYQIEHTSPSADEPTQSMDDEQNQKGLDDQDSEDSNSEDQDKQGQESDNPDDATPEPEELPALPSPSQQPEPLSQEDRDKFSISVAHNIVFDLLNKGSLDQARLILGNRIPVSRKFTAVEKLIRAIWEVVSRDCSTFDTRVMAMRALMCIALEIGTASEKRLREDLIICEVPSTILRYITNIVENLEPVKKEKFWVNGKWERDMHIMKKTMCGYGKGRDFNVEVEVIIDRCRPKHIAEIGHVE
ncbi:hypothetical protein G7Y89_g10784 [Cudoniella acicularis]|uniref:Uncharacterized protein n=1 Tax=Cudoniella acicularis TaxID=354080 RepID=A0A8H4RET1_9HELO|nr:hypothetical protein G7Y89_g10784 [Cudoniella acicularis]